ncbi:unnamed protein product [Echinostoma caproni]|uniref:Uncharacterized protein n=1 Tax=Echinostoma caproni TaxID=27848 RepID=A0A183B6E8_9TREM|nr:unnamed protein product [Echinostoma caproni]
MNSTPLESLDLKGSARDIEDYFKRFDIWWFTRLKTDEVKKSAFFLNAAGKNAYTLIKNLAYPCSPVSVLQHVNPTNFEASERAKCHSMVRNLNQGISELIMDLLTQAAKYDFGYLLHMQLRDQLRAVNNNIILQNELLKLFTPTSEHKRTHCEQYPDIRAATSSMPSTIKSTAM